MKPALALLAALTLVTLVPSLAGAQTASMPVDPNRPVKTINGAIASMDLVNCASAYHPDTCQVLLNITAGPTTAVETYRTLNDVRPAPSVVTVTILPQTPIVWSEFNRDIPPAELQAGDEVTIQYQKIEGQNIATQVNVSLI
jgi:hypothetical protein